MFATNFDEFFSSVSDKLKRLFENAFISAPVDLRQLTTYVLSFDMSEKDKQWVFTEKTQ